MSEFFYRAAGTIVAPFRYAEREAKALKEHVREDIQAYVAIALKLAVAGVALIVGIDRFMSEARALTSTMSNAVACVVVSIWEKACDREVLARELAQNYANTELALEEDAIIPIAAPAAGFQPVQLH